MAVCVHYSVQYANGKQGQNSKASNEIKKKKHKQLQETESGLCLSFVIMG